MALILSWTPIWNLGSWKSMSNPPCLRARPLINESKHHFYVMFSILLAFNPSIKTFRWIQRKILTNNALKTEKSFPKTSNNFRILTPKTVSQNLAKKILRFSSKARKKCIEKGLLKESSLTPIRNPINIIVNSLKSKDITTSCYGTWSRVTSAYSKLYILKSLMKMFECLQFN
jgi:hypothetical protein